jgi:PKHD-type hydroxylase
MINNTPEQDATVTPPFVTLSDVFTKNEFQLLESYTKKLVTNKAQIVEKDAETKNMNVRISDVCFLEPDQHNQFIFEKFNFLIDVANQKFFHFDLYGYDHIQYSTYNSNELGKYDWHIDLMLGNTNDTPSTRKLSISFLLNEPGVDFEGGDLEFLTGPTSGKVELNKNSALFFPSWQLHRVTPVTKGVRKSLVFWVKGPKFK